MERTTGYVEVGDGFVAVQSVGDGPATLVVVPGILSHVDRRWDDPGVARWLNSLARTWRVVSYDRRGTGASDPADLGDPSAAGDAELDAVLAWSGADAGTQAVVLGWFDGAAVAVSSVGDPRVRAAVAYAPYTAAPTVAAGLAAGWGSGDLTTWLRSRPPIDADERARWAALERATCTPRVGAQRLERLGEGAVDAASLSGPLVLLPVTRAPARWDADWPAVADPEITVVGVDGADVVPWGEGAATLVRTLAPLARGLGGEPTARRVLRAVMVTDIVDSTRRAAAAGDDEWRHLLEVQEDVTAVRVAANGGVIGRRTGDGIVASFELASAALSCALESVAEAQRVGLPVRVGVHVGEVDLAGTDPRGLTARLAVAVADRAGAGEVLFTSAVRDAVRGLPVSGAAEPRGFRDVPGWGRVEVFSLRP